MPVIQIEALDTLFFRDGKPFNMGDETWAESSIIVPYPSVFWGAIFTALISNNQLKYNEKDTVRINNTYLYNSRLNRILIPAPLDLFYNKKKLGYFNIEKYEGTPNSNITKGEIEGIVVPDTDENVDSSGNLFISIDDFADSYYERNERCTVYKINDVSTKSPKIGIGRNNQSRSSEEGQLFRVEMIELIGDWGYLVELETDKAVGDGILKLGGEGKTASHQELIGLPEILKNSLDKINQFESAKYLKIYIQSPTFWESGNGITELKTVEGYKLISACIGKFLSIGGFDVQAGKPKPMRKAVPAGSVYLMYAESGTCLELKEKIQSIIKLHNSNGFGKFYIIPLKED